MCLRKKLSARVLKENILPLRKQAGPGYRLCGVNMKKYDIQGNVKAHKAGLASLSKREKIK